MKKNNKTNKKSGAPKNLILKLIKLIQIKIKEKIKKIKIMPI